MGVISCKQAESIPGRLHWFESFAFGRVGNQANKTLGVFLVGWESKNVSLSQSVRVVLTFLKDRVLVAPPLKLVPASLLCWIIFADGASEGEDVKTGGVGGVLISPHGCCCSYFGDVAPEFIMKLLSEASLNPIFELEVCPVLVAVSLWKEKIFHSQTVFCLDNDAARSAYIKGVKGDSSLVQLELELQIRGWFSGAPSRSNIPDAPSRLNFKKLDACKLADCISNGGVDETVKTHPNLQRQRVR